MFEYNLPEGLNSLTYVTPEGQIKFDPPVYMQRYVAAVRIIDDKIWNSQLKKVVDFGCSEMALFPLLRRIPHVEHILEVDVDGELLKLRQSIIKPLISDYLQKRETPLHVEILQGSITDAVAQLCDVDAVVGLEIIEHLHSDVLDKVPENVFGFIQPKLAIFSTPNSEYNVLFEPLLENGFRHYDHKFEWTRKEFESWALDICKSYSNYKVSFFGLGKPPIGHEKLGHATQLAIFARNDIRGEALNNEIVRKQPTSETLYKLIYAVDFPIYKDERSKEQKFLDETNFYINRVRYNPVYFDTEERIYKFPWIPLLEFVESVGGTQNELLDVLKTNNFNVEDEYIILPEYDEDDGSDDLDYNGEFNLEAQPLKFKIWDEEENDLSINLASGCILSADNGDNDTEEDWD